MSKRRSLDRTMAPKKKKGKKQEQELEEEAIAEWLARGLDVKDYTMEKMMAIWLEEDGDDSDEEGDTLSAKQELMKGLSVLEPVIEQAKELAERVAEVVKEEAINAAKTAWKYAEIPPLKRRRLLREHVANVHEMDREANKYSIIRQRVRDEWHTAQAADRELAFGLKKRNARKEPLLVRSRQMKEEADREQQARLMEEIESKRRARMDEELSEKKRQRTAKEEFAEAQRVYRRKMNMKFWKKQYVEAKEFAHQHSLHTAEKRSNQFNDQVALMKAEIAEMNGEEAADIATDFDRNLSAASPGIFSTNLKPGEWHSAIDGGPREGMDEQTVGLFSARAFEAENELLRIEYMEAQSTVMKLREKLELVHQVKLNLRSDRKLIMERKDKLVVEIKQVTMEQDELGQQLAGPPRREPTEDDKRQIHTLVTRRAEYSRQLQELNARESNIHQRSELATRSEAALGPMLDKALAVEADLERRVKTIEQKQTDLPMVIGRSIQRDAGVIAVPEATEITMQVSEPIVNPAKLYADLTMESKLRILETAAVPVKDHFKKAKQLMIDDWKTKELHALGEQELEVTKNRLGRIRDGLISQQKDSVRADLMQAIVRFHQGPLKLRKCIFPVKGRFEWWQLHDPKRSTGYHVDERLGVVYLDPEQHSGQLRGCVRLPKSCVFRLRLSIKVLKCGDDGEWADAAATDEEKHVYEELVDQASEVLTFYIGGDYDSLQEHVFLDLGGHPVRTGDLTFEYYGARLCFSFAMVHRQGRRASEASYRLAVENLAFYEERLEDFREEESRMRLLQKEQHVVSELVKTLRMQTKKTSSERCADLLEELILVEKSKASTWDSTLLHGHQQRFKRSEYARMLRVEIKKELAHQIDHDVQRRQGRVPVQPETAVGLVEEGEEGDDDDEAAGRSQEQTEDSKMEFLLRKHVLVEPQYRKAKQSLGDYCSFKADAPAATEEASYRREALVMGLRLEWREGKTKLHVMHKLVGPPSDTNSESRPTAQWCPLDSTNAVFLAGACAKALQTTRQEAAKARAVAKHNDEQLHQLHEATQLTIQAQRDAEAQAAVEDAVLLKQKESELRRRGRLFYADAIRTTTYNEQVSMQIEFLAKRRLHAAQQQQLQDDDGEGDEGTAYQQALQQVKDEYASKTREGRLALVNKTWERKEKRLQDQREKERREREFRINQEQQLAQAIRSSTDLEMKKLQAEQAQRLREQLRIPDFALAVRGAFACEHREVKAWGDKYGAGARCKACGKEMSQSFDEPDHTRGADPQLDRDVEQQRAETTGGLALRLRDAGHFQRVEDERGRLEKEARELELVDSRLYDRAAPKAIEQFNYRHNMNRHGEAVDGSDALYQREVQEARHAAFQEEILFHGRLKNYQFRVNQLSDLHAHTTTMIAVQRDFLDNVQEENEFVLAKLPLVERDHARAIRLVEEDVAATKALEMARKELNQTRKERERAYYALEGVEEEAEFAEFHAPALVESSADMTAVVERLQAQADELERQFKEAETLLKTKEDQRKQADNVLAKLGCYDAGTRVRTQYGFCRVAYFRSEDDTVVVTPETWAATIYVPVGQLLATEKLHRAREAAMLAAEDTRMHRFIAAEQAREHEENQRMQGEDDTISRIVAWRQKKEKDEAILRTAVCEAELQRQFEYDVKDRKTLVAQANETAKKLYGYAPVSLRRRGKPLATRPSRLTVMRVARASEKRLAMAAMEQALLQRDAELRGQFRRENDERFAKELSQQVFDTAMGDIIKQLTTESLKEEHTEDLQTFHHSHNHGIVMLEHGRGQPPLPVHIAIRLDRLWVARRRQYSVLYAVWQREFTKLTALRMELSRREEIRRKEEEERLRLERRRKEMQTEERRCRQFYMDEMALCMRERKAMASAEMEMREYERLLQVEAMKAKYAKMVEERNRVNDKAARRLEIKLGKNEKHRLYREWAAIKIEDDLAMQLRDEEIARSQAEALERLFDRFLVQQALDGKLALERDAAARAERLREAQAIEAEKKKAWEAKLLQERMMATVEAHHFLAKVELEWMDSVERVAFWRDRSVGMRANLEPMTVELKRILAEKDHVVADAKAKRAHAEACKQRATLADSALRQAIKAEEVKALQYKKIHALNSTMDSAVLHGRPQLFKTVYLRDQLHTRYFSLLTEWIVRQAIAVCNERETARLEAKLRQIEEEQAFKIKEIGVLKRKRRRQLLMQLKRSALGTKLFGLSQRRVLRDRFQQWVKLWSQRVMVRASFQAKHGLLMQQHRVLERRTQLAKEDIETKLTVLHAHQKRRVQCRLCRNEYTEEQNNRYACQYHPGAYELACVSSCPTRQQSTAAAAAATSLTTCMMHRARRWLCCDVTDEGRYGSNGCATRFHLPARDNPALQDLVKKKEQQEATLLDQVERQLSELKERNVLGKSKQATKTTVAKIEQELAAKRAIAAKYFTLDQRS